MKQPVKNVNISIASVALEDDIDNFNLEVTQELAVVTAFGDAGPRRVVGNYDYGLSIGGGADFAASQSDATLFALVGDANGAAMAVDPTGTTAGSDDPNYDSTSVVLESYSVSGQTGGRVDFSAQLRGAAALARAVA